LIFFSVTNGKVATTAHNASKLARCVVVIYVAAFPSPRKRFSATVARDAAAAPQNLNCIQPVLGR
jgi:hypothetical protein